jgi:hypothetical protein
MEDELIFVFVILTLVISLGAEAVLFCAYGPNYDGLSLAIGAFLSLYIVQNSARHPGCRW